MIEGVYLVLDPDQTGGRPAREVAAAALRGGVRMAQWRQKGGSVKARWQELLAVRQICRAGGVPLLVNDRVDVALAVDAEGAHVGQDDLPAECARALLPGRLLGVSVTRLAEIEPAVRGGADYLGVGPIFPTDSKLDAAPEMGLDMLRQVRALTDLPIVAIGGITVENAARVRASGADAVAVISAVCGARDVEEAASRLAEQLERVGT